MVLAGIILPNLCKVLSIVPGTQEEVNKYLAFAPSTFPLQL